MEPKITILTQARIGSSRFPSKILQPIDANMTMIEMHLYRLHKLKTQYNIVVATTFETGIETLLIILDKLHIEYHQGSSEDVLDRFYSAIKDVESDYIVRVTSDCPLIDADLVDAIVRYTIENSLDYCSNVLVENFPDGQDVEVLKTSVLKDAWRNATLKSDREHVTPYIKRNSSFCGGDLYRSMNYDCDGSYGHIRMTVDEQLDLDAIKLLVSKLGVDSTWKEYADFMNTNPLLFRNQMIIRNEGYVKSKKND